MSGYERIEDHHHPRIGKNKRLKWEEVQGQGRLVLLAKIIKFLSSGPFQPRHSMMRFLRFAIFSCALVVSLPLVLSSGLVSLLHAEPAEVPDTDLALLLQQKPPMRVVVVRNSEPGCEPNCAEWISAEGVIKPETPALFEDVLNGLGTRKLPVFINSPGGIVDAGLSIGRMIRSHQLDVVVSTTVFKPCPGAANNCSRANSSVVYYGEPHSSGAICASACTFILAGGTRRFVAPWARVGVHQITMFEKHVQRTLTFKTMTTFTSPNSELVTRQSLVGEKDNTRIVKLDVPRPETLKSIEDFFKDMGISDALPNLAKATKPDSLHWLTYSELGDTHIATDYRGSEYLAALNAEGRQTNVSDSNETSLSYGLLRMESFTRRPVLVLLEFYHRKGDLHIELFAFLSERDQFVSNANFALSLEFDAAKQFEASKHGSEIEGISARPFGPIYGSFPDTELCKARSASAQTKLTLIQVTKGARLAGPTAAIDLRQLSGMNDLMAELCTG